MRNLYMKAIQLVCGLCLCFASSAKAYELPMRYVQSSTDYLIKRCNAVTKGCVEHMHIMFRSLRLVSESVFYVQIDDETNGLLIYEIAILDGKGKLLLRCDIYTDDGSVINNECTNPISRGELRRRL